MFVAGGENWGCFGLPPVGALKRGIRAGSIVTTWLVLGGFRGSRVGR
jgi:hypothetical protein